ncbi:TetR/AcrR family transcriptional regulator [Psychromonas sp. B3M02]|uniref:TetR/AcrR family transcriptional regulator n=1 Tax=Psychromonas sp. B3M02 TaxID=2267226 RepID=UPI000DE9D653|nr:TetR/AcrR family transcriptional regulator [Psychromonas sp. B3M02]RBW47857.1 TetR/AcrR family transcriptional regulator [Psychromonas sp. B3M02]
MARKKNYEDSEVIAKATELFWRNSYHNTSMSLLESTMGINKFSIYASFGSKQGVFLASLKAYRDQHSSAFIKLKYSQAGVADIKQFFYDCLTIYGAQDTSKGCLMTNTRLQINSEEETLIINEIQSFVDYQRQLFSKKLQEQNVSEQQALRIADYLIIAKQSVSAASKVHPIEQVHDFIEITFDAVNAKLLN